jgi:hypothetical protein
MEMPVIVGLVVAILFIVAFSEWFYHLVSGWGDFVLDDVYFRYRIMGISLFSMLIMGGTFYGMALINECPSEVREGLFAKLNCEEYSKIKVGTEKMLISIEKKI